MTSRKDAPIAYFGVQDIDDGREYIGAILVIDEKGVPQEIRCTLPLRPTPIQKTLYGESLKPHLFNELIGLPLVRSLNTKPHCCVVENSLMLGLREYVRLPVIHLMKSGETFSIDDPNQTTKSHRLTSTISGFEPITARTQPGYDGDYDMVSQEFEQIFNYMDLMEPFERITTSIKVLKERDSRFK